MPGAVRLSDMSTGHPHCYPATPAVGASHVRNLSWRP